MKRALDKGGYLPERKPENVKSALEDSSTQEFVIDGTERLFPRPKDKNKQKSLKSGKKKDIPVKTT